MFKDLFIPHTFTPFTNWRRASVVKLCDPVLSSLSAPAKVAINRQSSRGSGVGFQHLVFRCNRYTQGETEIMICLEI